MWYATTLASLSPAPRSSFRVMFWALMKRWMAALVGTNTVKALGVPALLVGLEPEGMEGAEDAISEVGGLALLLGLAGAEGLGRRSAWVWLARERRESKRRRRGSKGVKSGLPLQRWWQQQHATPQMAACHARWAGGGAWE